MLYQLSYCGEPWRGSGEWPKTPAPDIGRAAILQEKRGARTAEPSRFRATWHPVRVKKTRQTRTLAAPAGQKPAPAAGLAGGVDLFSEFIDHTPV
ncbi:MAG: hypothetical protein WA650_05795, partial [Bradyrhizobium sp.]